MSDTLVTAGIVAGSAIVAAGIGGTAQYLVSKRQWSERRRQRRADQRREVFAGYLRHVLEIKHLMTQALADRALPPPQYREEAVDLKSSSFSTHPPPYEMHELSSSGGSPISFSAEQ